MRKIAMNIVMMKQRKQRKTMRVFIFFHHHLAKVRRVHLVAGQRK
jgi:hypothetical protein